MNYLKTALEAYCANSKESQRDVKKRISLKLYPDSSEMARQMNVNHLFSGAKKNISLDHLKIICDEFKTTPSAILGYLSTQNPDAIEEIKKIVNRL
jgi:DNA-binding Xre family transcriptional regulator